MGQDFRLRSDKPGPHGLDGRIAGLAARQHGVVAATQLLALGLTREEIHGRVEAERLHRLHRGVYAVGHRALSARARTLAAVLACGSGALLSHRSAGGLWGVLRGTAGVEVTTPRTRGPRAGIVVHRSRVIHPDDRALVDAIPVTSVARTLIDLADVLSERRLADAVHESEVLRLFDLCAIEAALGRLAGRKGRHRLRRVLAGYTERPDTKSRLERRFLALLAKHGLPGPRVNTPIGPYTVDAHWPDAALVVELDGGAAHHTRRAFQRDRERDRELAASGIQVVRVTSQDLGRGVRLAAELRAIRARRLAEARGA